MVKFSGKALALLTRCQVEKDVHRWQPGKLVYVYPKSRLEMQLSQVP